MPIIHSKGSTTIVGDAFEYFRICQLKAVVGLELRGIKMNRGPVVWKRVKEQYSIPGNKQAVYAWLCNKVAELRSQQEHVDDETGRRTVGGEEVQ